MVCSINDLPSDKNTWDASAMLVGFHLSKNLCLCLLKTIWESCCLPKILIFLWVAQHEMEVAELCTYVMQMLWIEEGAHLLYSFYSHFSIKEKWDSWEIHMWGEPSQKGSLKKAWKGTNNPFSFDDFLGEAWWDLLFTHSLFIAVFPSRRSPRVLMCLKYFTMWTILMVTLGVFFFFFSGESVYVKGSRL